MKAAVIAAGRGERMRASGLRLPKPLLPVAGRPLLLRVLDGYRNLPLDEVVLITNRGFARRLKAAVDAESWPFRRRWIVKTTPSSFHSFREIARALRGHAFLMSTVDSLCPPGAVRGFLRKALRRPDLDMVLGLTRLVHDEKPLWVRLDRGGAVTAMGPQARGSLWVTAGIYFFWPACFRAGLGEFRALREFLAERAAAGRVAGVPLPDVVDVDRPSDIRLAERLLGWAKKPPLRKSKRPSPRSSPP